MNRKVIFLLDNLENPQIPNEGDIFCKKNHIYFAPLIRNEPLNLTPNQIINKVFRIDMSSNYFIVVTDEAYFIYPVKRFDRGKFDKKIFFAIVDKIPTSYSFKELKVYYISDSNSDVKIEHKTMHKATFLEGIGQFYENIYISESLSTTTFFFVKEQ